MAISPPSFQKDAIPTPNGWVHPKTNELLLARRINKEDINEYLSPAAAPQPLRESPVTEAEFVEEIMESDAVDFDSMTKRELEEFGREHGVELDRRENKQSLIAQVKTLMD
tara:strand:+ start:32 stop:364 length:333 start_codon:yes stop_codon:yes gene_type:complete